jgi:DNA invertase Pin-like site-specific DNA recombinase
MHAGVYLRQSRDRDLDEETGEKKGLAIARQREDCLRLCRERGWEVAEEYPDNDFSAYSGKRRPQYERMLADIEAGKLDAVVVWDLDRLHRRPIELEQFIDLADRCRLALATVSGDTDLGTDSGRLFARVKGAVARAEGERKSARQKRAALQGAQQGRPHTGTRAFGYESDGVTVRPGEAEALARAYRSLLAGSTLTSIAKDLNGQGFSTSKGNVISRNAVRAMLANPRNAGQSSYHGEIVGVGQWPAIVDLDTFEAARALLTDSRRIANHSNARRWLLSNLAECGVCGDGTKVGVNYRHNRSGSRSRIYVCPKFHLSREATFCDERVTQRVIARISRDDARDLLVDHDRPDVEALRAEQHTLHVRLDQFAIDYADGTITASQLHKGTERLRARLAELDAQMVHIDRAPLLEDLITAGDVYAIWQMLPLDRRRAVISLLYQVVLLPRPGGRPPAGDPLDDPMLLATVRMEPKI